MSDGKPDIPVTWIYEQIMKNPGRHASSWKYLLDLWDKKLLEDVKNVVLNEDWDKKLLEDVKNEMKERNE